MTTTEEKFWQSDFGNDYSKRNNFSNKDLDAFYIKNLGVTRSSLNKEFLNKLKIRNILEVGCNIGNQLAMLQSQGFDNLYGIEINESAIELSKQRTKNINIIKGSGFDIPFKDSRFDLVFTSGVLIHINPKNVKQIMTEAHRVSKKYIWGIEYFNDTYTNIPYRGHKSRLWKGNFAQMYLDAFPRLKLVKEKRYEKINGNIWSSFLLKKI